MNIILRRPSNGDTTLYWKYPLASQSLLRNKIGFHGARPLRCRNELYRDFSGIIRQLLRLILRYRFNTILDGYSGSARFYCSRSGGWYTERAPFGNNIPPYWFDQFGVETSKTTQQNKLFKKLCRSQVNSCISWSK